MPVEITATELAKSLSDVLNRVRYKGETFRIVRNKETIATLGPTVPGPGVTLGTVAAILKDLFPPGEGFADDLEEIQASQPGLSTPPWP